MTRAETGSTLPQLLLARVAERPDAVAVLRKRYGIWQGTSFSQLAAQVEAVARGLSTRGLGAGGSVVVLSDNRPEWLVVELAVQSLGAAVLGPHADSTAEEVAELLGASRADLLVVEDQHQWEKVTGSAPAGVVVVCLDARGVRAEGERAPVPLAELEAAGSEDGTARPGWWRERVAEGTGADVAVRGLPTAASDAPEQGQRVRTVALTHDALVAGHRAFTERDPLSRDVRYVSVLPLGWHWEQVVAVTGCLTSGFPLCFPEGPATQQLDLRDIGPDLLLAPPRIWEALAAEVQSAADGSGRLRRASWQWAVRTGSARTGSGGAGRLADLLVLRSVRDRLGMSRLRRAWSFGAPLRPDVQAFFRSLGVDLRQAYGVLDAGGPLAAQPPGSADTGTVGTALPGVELRLSDAGEVLARRTGGPAAPSATPEGWAPTGDKGRFDGDQLVVVDRLADVLVVDGHDVSPSVVESWLRASPYVEDAVVFLARDGLAALVVVDPVAVGGWAETSRLHASSYEELTRLPEVAELVAGELARLAEHMPEGVPVRRCALLPRRLDADLGEVTRSLLVRRRVVAAHFADELHALLETAAPMPQESPA